MKEINLLIDKSSSFWHKKTAIRFFLATTFSIAILSVGIIDFYIKYQINQLKKHKDKLSHQLVLVSSDISKLQKEKTQFDHLERLAQAFRNKQRQSIKIVKLLSELKTVAPGVFLIKSSGYSPPCLGTTGWVQSEKKFLALINSLAENYPSKIQYSFQDIKKEPLAFTLKMCFS